MVHSSPPLCQYRDTTRKPDNTTKGQLIEQLVFILHVCKIAVAALIRLHTSNASFHPLHADTNGLLGPSLSTTGGSSPSCSLGYEGAPVPQGYLGRRPSHIGDQAGPSGCSRFLRRTPPHQAVSELDEASRATLQEELSPTLSCRKLAATDTRGVHFFFTSRALSKPSWSS